VSLRGSEASETISAQIVPEPLQAFVWGDKWRDMSKSLPGIMSGSSFALQLCISIVSMLLPGLAQLQTGTEIVQTTDAMGNIVFAAKNVYALGQTMYNISMVLKMSLSLAMFTQGLSSLTSTMATGCVLKGACSQNAAFILSTAISVAGSMAAGGALGAANGGAINSAAASAFGSMEQAVKMGTASLLVRIVVGFENFMSNVGNAISDVMHDILAPLGTAINKVISSVSSWVATHILGGASSTSSPGAEAPQTPPPLPTPPPPPTPTAIFFRNFSVGLVLGAVKGTAELAITKAVDNAFCPPSNDPNSQCSGTNQILEQGVGVIANTIGSQLAVLATAYAANDLSDTYTFTQALGVKTEAQSNATATAISQTVGLRQGAIATAQAGGVDSSYSSATQEFVGLSNNPATQGMVNSVTAGMTGQNADGTFSDSQIAKVDQIVESTFFQQQFLNSMSTANMIGKNPVNGALIVNTGSAPVGFGTAMAQAIVGDFPNIVGQLASMSVRLAALKWAGVQPENNISNALGMAANIVSSTVFSNAINTQATQQQKQQTLNAAIIGGLFDVGMGFVENSVIGRYSQTKAQENPAYSYDYSTAQAQFQALTLLASSTISAGVMLAIPANTAHYGVDTKDDVGTGAKLWTTLFTVSPGTIAMTNAASGGSTGPEISTLPASSYTPSMLTNFSTGFGGAQLLGNYAQNGSWGSVADFVNYSDIQDERIGFTADAAVSADNMWKIDQENNRPIYSVQRSIGGLIGFSVTPSVSGSMLFDQDMISLLESRSLGAPGTNINYLANELQSAANASVLNMSGVLTNLIPGMVTKNDDGTVSFSSLRNELTQWGLPNFGFDEVGDGQKGHAHHSLFIGQYDAQDSYNGADRYGDLVFSKKVSGEKYPAVFKWIFPNRIGDKLKLDLNGISNPVDLTMTIPNQGLGPNAKKSDWKSLLLMGGSAALEGTPIAPLIMENALTAGMEMGLSGGNGKGLTLNYSTTAGLVKGQRGLSQTFLHNINSDGKAGWSESIVGVNPQAQNEANAQKGIKGTITNQNQGEIQYFDLSPAGKEIVKDYFQGTLTISNDQGKLAHLIGKGALSDLAADSMKTALEKRSVPGTFSVHNYLMEKWGYQSNNTLGQFATSLGNITFAIPSYLSSNSAYQPLNLINPFTTGAQSSGAVTFTTPNFMNPSALTINPEMAAQLSGDVKAQTVTNLTIGVADDLAKSGYSVTEQVGLGRRTLPEPGKAGSNWLMYFTGSQGGGISQGQMIVGGDFDVDQN